MNTTNEELMDQVLKDENKVEMFMKELKRKNPHEPEFLQAAHDVSTSIIPFMETHPKYKKFKILERIAEPERVIMFMVPWLNDKGEIEINRGYRVQMSSAIGPYKGGLRFHRSVTLSILKFLALEQVF